MSAFSLSIIVIIVSIIDTLFIDRIVQKLPTWVLLTRSYSVILFGSFYLVLMILYVTSPNKIAQSIELPVYKIDGCNIVVYHYDNESYVQKITKEHARFEVYERGPYYGLYNTFTATNLREYD